MEAEVGIKLATSDDAKQVLQFLQQAAKESDAVLIPHLKQVTAPQEAKNIDLINQFDDCVMMLAMLDKEVVGIVTVMVLADQPTTGELGVVVGKKYWRNGIGQLLVDEAEYWFENYSSLETLVLSVFKTNEAAIKLYQKMNFKIISRRAEKEHAALQMQYIPDHQD